jgi:chemotaxis protein CheZ
MGFMQSLFTGVPSAMSAARKIYRIEQASRAELDPETTARERHGAVMAKLDALAASMARGVPATATAAAAPAPSKDDETAREMLNLYKAELNEARKLKRELDEIKAAIDRTKREIATLARSGQSGGSMNRVSDELDAVVHGTENATNVILAAAEVIDEQSRNLAAKLGGDDQGMAGDIQDQVVKIFEACNFQDLTGQRITKVVGVLRFVDERVHRMIEIWGGMDRFQHLDAPADAEAPGEERRLLNGPALPADEGRATQSMIDALFP